MIDDPIKIIDIPQVDYSIQNMDLSSKNEVGQIITNTRVSHKKIRKRNKKRNRIKKNKSVRRKRILRMRHSKEGKRMRSNQL
ncbi:hypothetical protein D3C78_1030600 [compost metagenome]